MLKKFCFESPASKKFLYQENLCPITRLHLARAGAPPRDAGMRRYDPEAGPALQARRVWAKVPCVLFDSIRSKGLIYETHLPRFRLCVKFRLRKSFTLVQGGSESL